MRLDWNVFFALALVCVVWTKACSIVSSSSHEIGNYRASVRSDSLADDAVWCEPISQGGYSLLCGKEQGISRLLRTSDPHLAPADREITLVFEKIP
jgi:hypothetical protein